MVVMIVMIANRMLRVLISVMCVILLYRKVTKSCGGVQTFALKVFSADVYFYQIPSTCPIAGIFPRKFFHEDIRKRYTVHSTQLRCAVPMEAEMFMYKIHI